MMTKYAWPPVAFSSESAWGYTEDAEDNPPHLKAGCHLIYWRVVMTKPIRGVYNIPNDRLAQILERITRNPAYPYEDLVGDVPGAGYADEGEFLQYIEG